jgi:hypothetical protein
MNCRACGLAVRKVYPPGICLFCVQRMEQAIERWVDSIEHDLQRLVEFDAYLATRETVGPIRDDGD